MLPSFPGFLLPHSLTMPFSSLCYFSKMEPELQRCVEGPTDIRPKVFRSSRRDKDGSPVRSHCEAEKCVIPFGSCLFVCVSPPPPALSPSISCPAPLPRAGRKCSLKASPPTAEAQSITVRHKYTPWSDQSDSFTSACVLIVDCELCGVPRANVAANPNALKPFASERWDLN